MKENNNLVKTGASANHWLLILIAVVLALGIFFRFVNLDKKPVWVDETHTFSVISGYSDSEVIEKLSANRIVNVGDFLKHQYPNPDKNLSDSLRKLYTDVHPPLYFLIARSWVEWFGHSVASLRSVSAVFSILVLPCVYWICWELFKLPIVSWVATALFCVSPFQVLYAQEARPYSLLTFVVLFSGAALLWGIRTQKKAAWFTYAIAVTLGLYSQFFFIFVVFGYLAYMFLIEPFRLTKKLKSFLFATFISFIAFSPWAITVFIHLADFKDKSSWIKNHSLTILGAIRLWSENISFSFIDPRTSDYLGFGKFGLYFLIPLILILVGYSFYFLYFKTAKQVYLFVFTLIGSTALPLIAADLILGGNRQIWPRYIVPCLLGVQISVAYLLGTKISTIDAYQGNWNRRVWLMTTGALITAGVIFCAIISQADTWWNKYGGEPTIRVSQIIRQAKNPLIIVNPKRPSSVFFYHLSPEVNLLFTEDEKLAILSRENNNDIFLLNPNQEMKAALKIKDYSLQMVAQFPDPGPVPGSPTELWQIKRLNNI
jgi:uncharacterized membrane protein